MVECQVGLPACSSDDQTAFRREFEPNGLSWHAEVLAPAFTGGLDPRVCIDQGHNNFHTAEETYGPFASLLREDGYVVEGFDSAFSTETLQRCRILVTVSPVADANDLDQNRNWAYPTFIRFLAGGTVAGAPGTLFDDNRSLGTSAQLLREEGRRIF